PSGAVERHISRLRRKAYQRSNPALHGSKAVTDFSGTRTHSTGEIASERIVPACVQKKNIRGRFALHDPLHKVELYHFEFECFGRCQFSVDRYKIVLARHLKTMARIEEDASFGVGECACKFQDLLIEASLV